MASSEPWTLRGAWASSHHRLHTSARFQLVFQRLCLQHLPMVIGGIWHHGGKRTQRCNRCVPPTMMIKGTRHPWAYAWALVWRTVTGIYICESRLSSEGCTIQYSFATLRGYAIQWCSKDDQVQTHIISVWAVSFKCSTQFVYTCVQFQI